MKHIYLLIGIPGAGKSYWLQDKFLKENCILDDISQLKDPLALLQDALNNSNIKNIYIADVNFLDLLVLKKAENLIIQYIGNQHYSMSYIVFKSNKEISEHNVKLRDDGRNVTGTIKRFHKNYPEVIHYLTDKNLEIIESTPYKKMNKKIK